MWAERVFENRILRRTGRPKKVGEHCIIRSFVIFNFS
jgi:hypothetical protein